MGSSARSQRAADSVGRCDRKPAWYATGGNTKPPQESRKGRRIRRRGRIYESNGSGSGDYLRTTYKSYVDRARVRLVCEVYLRWFRCFCVGFLGLVFVAKPQSEQKKISKKERPDMEPGVFRLWYNFSSMPLLVYLGIRKSTIKK